MTSKEQVEQALLRDRAELLQARQRIAEMEAHWARVKIVLRVIEAEVHKHKECRHLANQLHILGKELL